MKEREKEKEREREGRKKERKKFGWLLYLSFLDYLMFKSLFFFFFFLQAILRFSVTILSNPSARAGYDTKSISKRSLTGLNSEISFSKTSRHSKAEEISLSYYLPITGERIIGFIPFPRVLVLCEIQPASSRIWTRVAVSISYDYNH